MSDTPIINILQPTQKIVNISVEQAIPRVVNVQINSSNRVLSVNGKVGNVFISGKDVGLGNVENISILTTSGYLQNEINVLNNQTGNYYPNTNPSGFITGVVLTGYALNSQTGSFVTTAQTGAFYAATNPSGFITGVDLSSYALKSQTGTFVTTAQTGAFYAATNPSGYITGVDLSNYALKSQTGSFVTTAQTGAFYAASNPSGYITGVDLSNYALKSQTGAFITTGQTGNFYAASNPSGFISVNKATSLAISYAIALS